MPEMAPASTHSHFASALPFLPTTLVTFVQATMEAIAANLFAACQYSSCLLLLLFTALAGANWKATAVRLASGKKSIGRPLSRRKRARNLRKARVCLALSVLKVGMQ